jgi:hypothetical protein
MIIIRNTAGSVCCRTSNPEHLCQKCKQQYQQLRNEDQSDMLVVPVMNYSSDKKPVPNYRGQGVDEILFGRRDLWAEAAEDEITERESSFTTNDDDLDQEDVLLMPRRAF